jgi:GNAT superfamily N-acetyltransferase
MTRNDGYELSGDPQRIDIDRVHRWLSTESYWARHRPREVVARSISRSAVYGIYRPGDRVQVAFARAVTDEATFAWLCDVFVTQTERGHGLGTWLVSSIRDDLATRGVPRILLATADAHGVYAKLGFTALAEPSQWMALDCQRPSVTAITRKDQTQAGPLR